MTAAFGAWAEQTCEGVAASFAGVATAAEEAAGEKEALPGHEDSGAEEGGVEGQAEGDGVVREGFGNDGAGHKRDDVIN